MIEHDRLMTRSWRSLKEAEKEQIAIAYKDHFEETVTAPALVTMPPRIVLYTWTKGLSTRMDAANASNYRKIGS